MSGDEGVRVALGDPLCCQLLAHCSKACPWRTPALCLDESEQRQWVIGLLSLFSDFNTKRFKRTRIYFNTDTQCANFRGNPLWFKQNLFTFIKIWTIKIIV